MDYDTAAARERAKAESLAMAVEEQLNRSQQAEYGGALKGWRLRLVPPDEE